jgi:uncharacterized ion transporter superfamily protein YfcC
MDGENNNIEKVSERFQKKSQRASFLAFFVLFLLIVSLSVGIYIFSQADYIAVDVEKRNTIESLKHKIASLDSEIKRQEKQAEEWTKDKRDTRYITPLIEEDKKKLEELKKRVELEKRESTVSIDNTRYLTIMLSTKVGSVVLLLFLVQILGGLYRYNMRLATFYSNRADVLALIKNTNNPDLNSLVASLLVDHIDIKVPESPIDQIINIAKQLKS